MSPPKTLEGHQRAMYLTNIPHKHHQQNIGESRVYIGKSLAAIRKLEICVLPKWGLCWERRTVHRQKIHQSKWPYRQTTEGKSYSNRWGESTWQNSASTFGKNSLQNGQKAAALIRERGSTKDKTIPQLTSSLTVETRVSVAADARRPGGGWWWQEHTRNVF